ncbi:hypothetical protein Aperf_G00000015658 [Anoplocephala perfoliata]
MPITPQPIKLMTTNAAILLMDSVLTQQKDLPNLPSTPALIEPHAGVLQFCTFLSTTSNTILSPANRVTTPCQPSFIVGMAAPGVAIDGNTSCGGTTEIASSPTLTCLGIFEAPISSAGEGVTGSAPQQVLLPCTAYSIIDCSETCHDSIRTSLL